MKRDHLPKLLAVGFGIAVLIYVVAFSWIEHLRTRKGGWQVWFSSDAAGVPTLSVSQPRLGLSNVALVFPDEHVPVSNLASSVVFDQPVTNLPFGRIVYLDTTFLPGSIVFNLFGHEVQLLPRVLLVDKQETPWRSGQILKLKRVVTGEGPVQHR
jgi:hypothetical protein